MEKQIVYDVHQLWTLYTSRRRWFLFSLLICLFLGVAYVFWTEPVFSVTGKVQIIERRGNTSSYSVNSLLQNQLPFGLGSSLGGSVSMETEKEILKSRLIARDAVTELGIYTEYRIRKWFRSRLVYKNNPINVTIDESTLKLMDESLPMVAYSIHLSIDKDEAGYRVNGYVKENKDKTELPEMVSASLPTSVNTSIGVLKLAENTELTAKDIKRYAKGYHLDVKVYPPMTQARKMAKRMALNPPSKKNSSILLIDFKDESILRGIDYVNAIVENYNKQSNEEKHKEAAKNDEFVKERLAKIDAELSSADEKWEISKKHFQVTEARVDAEEVMKKKSTYESQIVNIGIQQQMLDYLGEYVNDPANMFELIPVNMTGGRDSIPLINRHNQLVNERKKLLKSMTEQSTQVIQNKQMIYELHPAIQTSILRNKEALLMQRTAVEREYNKYMSRVGNVPEQERVLTEIGRDRNIKQGVYVSLLQKREENAMELAKTTDKGRLADATLFNKKVKPRMLIVLLLVIVLSQLLPFLYYYMREWLKGTVENSEDLRKLSELPVIGDIPVDGTKTEEAFHSIRSSLIHLMKEGQKNIMVTSDSSADGKTYTAIHLAKALSAIGKKVVLCDLNLRNPSFGNMLKVQSGKGWCEILSEEQLTSSDVLSVVHRQAPGCPDLLFTGTIPSVHPANLLAHEHLSQMIASLKDIYDYVILDTSAVGQNDEMLVDGLADATCYVCRSGKTPKTAIGHLNKLAVEARLISPMIVLNLG